jgi:hypothetical protein
LKTSSAKSKGRLLQKKVRDSVLDTFPELSELDVRSTSMGVSGVDIQLSKTALDTFPYSVECKSRAKMDVYRLWQDTTDNLAPNTNPLLVIKMNHKDPLAVVTLKHFMELTAIANKSRNRDS